MAWHRSHELPAANIQAASPVRLAARAAEEGGARMMYSKESERNWGGPPRELLFIEAGSGEAAKGPEVPRSALKYVKHPRF